MNEELIYKYLNGDASDEEIKLLHQWINESKVNRRLFSKSKNYWATFSSRLSPDFRSADFNRMINEIKIRSIKQKPKFYIRAYRAAAIFLFPVFLTIAAWYIWDNLYTEKNLAFNEVIAPPKAHSHIILSDGTNVWISPESRLVYPQEFGNKNRKVKLEGEGYFEVTHDKKNPFIVETEKMDIEVLGTSFNVEAYLDDPQTRTTLVRGKVKIHNNEIGQEVELTPGDQITLNKENKKINIEKVNTEIYKLVKEGILIFKRNSMAEVCRKLERWFMVPIEYKGKGNHGLLFTAKFENESLAEILQIIETTIPINYYIYDNYALIKDK